MEHKALAVIAVLLVKEKGVTLPELTEEGGRVDVGDIAEGEIHNRIRTRDIADPDGLAVRGGEGLQFGRVRQIVRLDQEEAEIGTDGLERGRQRIGIGGGIGGDRRHFGEVCPRVLVVAAVGGAIGRVKRVGLAVGVAESEGDGFAGPVSDGDGTAEFKRGRGIDYAPETVVFDHLAGHQRGGGLALIEKVTDLIVKTRLAVSIQSGEEMTLIRAVVRDLHPIERKSGKMGTVIAAENRERAGADRPGDAVGLQRRIPGKIESAVVINLTPVIHARSRNIAAEVAAAVEHELVGLLVQQIAAAGPTLPEKGGLVGIGEITETEVHHSPVARGHTRIDPLGTGGSDASQFFHIREVFALHEEEAQIAPVAQRLRHLVGERRLFKGNIGHLLKRGPSPLVVAGIRSAMRHKQLVIVCVIRAERERHGLIRLFRHTHRARENMRHPTHTCGQNRQ